MTKVDKYIINKEQQELLKGFEKILDMIKDIEVEELTIEVEIDYSDLVKE